MNKKILHPTLVVGLSMLLLMLSKTALANLDCSLNLTNQWSGGATAELVVVNAGSSTTTASNIVAEFSSNVAIQNVWNGSVSGSNPYTFSGPQWNQNLATGQSATIGMQLSFSGSFSAPTFSGACGGVTPLNQPPEISSFSCDEHQLVGDFFDLGWAVYEFSYVCDAVATDADGDTLEYIFDLGDGRTLASAGSSSTGIIDYVESDTYTIGVTVSDGTASVEASVEQAVTGMTQPPVVDFDCTVDSNNYEITCDGSASYDPDGDATAHYWAWDGTYDYSSGLTVATHRFSGAGEYAISLYVLDGNNSRHLTKTFTIEGSEPFDPILEFSCENEYHSSNSETLGFEFSSVRVRCDVDEYDPGFELTPIPTGSPGCYGASSSASSSSSTPSASGEPTPTPSPTAEPCIMPTYAPIREHRWTFGEGDDAVNRRSENSIAVHTFEESKTVDVTLTIEELQEGVTTTATGVLDIVGNGVAPVVSLECTNVPGSLTVTCDGSGSYDSDGDELLYTFAWDQSTNGVKTTNTTPIASHTYESPGWQYVTLYIVDRGIDIPNTGGHLETKQVSMELTDESETNRPPVADFTASDSRCVSFTKEFDASISSDPDGDDITFDWSILGDSFSGETLTFNGSSHIDETIDVALTVTDTEGATDSITREITIDNYPLPIASPPPVPDYDIFASSTSGDAPLTVDFELSDDFDWNEVDWYVDGERLVTAGPTNFSHTFEQPGTYEVMTYAVYIFDTTCDRRVGREAYITIEVLGDDPDTGGQSCEYVVTNDWGSGFTAELRYTNTGEAIISDWSATWEYTDGSSISSSWNGSVSGSNPYTATGVGWNSSLQPGQTATIGMQGVNGANSAATPTCQ